MLKSADGSDACKDPSRIYLGGIYLVFAVLLLFMMGAFFYTRGLIEGNRDNLYRIKEITLDGVPDSLSYRRIRSESTEEYHFQARFRKSDLPGDAGGEYQLIVYRIAADWMVFEVNGMRIGSAGNLKDNRTNIWNMVHYLEIPSGHLEDDNILSVRIAASDQLGGISYPLFLTDSYTSAVMKSWFDIILINITLFAQGVLVFAFVLFLFLAFSSDVVRRRDYLCFAAASFFMAINLIDYLPLFYFPIPYHLLKNITLGALYASVISINFGIAGMFSSRTARVLGLLLLTSFLVILLFFNREAWQFKQAYSFTNVLILASNIWWIWVTLRKRRVMPKAKILLAASCIMLIISVVDISLNIGQRAGYYPLTVLGAIYFCMGLSFLVVLDYLNVRIRLELECRKAETHYQSSIRDSLTGIYNRGYILEQLEGMPSPYAVMMIDLDRFKVVNDTFGHAAGDEVIRHLAEAASGVVRRNDLVGRFGGDEFIIVLPECDTPAALEIGERLRKKFEEACSQMHAATGRLTLSIGIYITRTVFERPAEALEKADMALYRSKEEGRDRISLYEN